MRRRRKKKVPGWVWWWAWRVALAIAVSGLMTWHEAASLHFPDRAMLWEDFRNGVLGALVLIVALPLALQGGIPSDRKKVTVFIDGESYSGTIEKDR
jgi:hypothetical protein